MKLVTFQTSDHLTHAGVIRDNQVIALRYPTLLELLHDPVGLDVARSALNEEQVAEEACVYALDEVTLLAPIPDPPTLRDFYAFEQHVKTARAGRGLEMQPGWYEIPTFYFSNTSEISGPEAPIPYPLGCRALDFELEIACVIGREGKNIALDEAADYIAGYTIMNDWSARDFQLQDMQLGLGPGKGKDFATSLGPCLVTPDEFASRRSGSGASERYDMTMLARINGKEVSRGNFKDIYYSFPQMIVRASCNARLRVGDVLGSGTVGTGCLLELGKTVHHWLQPGNVVELEIDGIGVLRNRIV
jgi:fumarylacetoacetate (FAA) hydrolase